MLIKRYLVRNMNEAMVRIRYELGGDAVIVSSRKIKQRGLKNLFKPKLLEVTAAIDSKQQQGEKADKKVNSATEPQEGRLEKELQELKSLVGILMEQKTDNEVEQKTSDHDVNENYDKAYIDRVIDNLRTMEVDEEIIDGFMSFCEETDDELVDEKAIKYFEDMISEKTLRQDMHEKVWAFIGPTGVGKTTTIAKVAAQEMLSNNKNVGLITLDTYRIGAVEQLKTYAKILNIPLEVVFNKADLINAMDRLKDCDLILLDSTGRNSLDCEQLLETKELLDTLEDKRNLLVVNAGMRRSDLKAIIDSYRSVGFDSIVLTKLDETKYYGNILNISKYSDKSLCFITTGQVVPDDIIKASEANLINYVLMGVQS